MVLVPLSLLNLKKSTAGAFVVAFRVLSRKKKNMTGDNVLFYKAYLRGEKKFKPRRQTGLFYLLLVLFKIFDEHPCLFCMGALFSPSPGGGGDL